MFWCLYICWTYIYIHQLSWHGNEFLPTGYCTSFSWKLVNTLICTFRGNVSCHLIFNHLRHIGHLNVLAHLLEAGVGKLSQRHFLLYFRKCPNIVTAIINQMLLQMKRNKSSICGCCRPLISPSSGFLRPIWKHWTIAVCRPAYMHSSPVGHNQPLPKG